MDMDAASISMGSVLENGRAVGGELGICDPGIWGGEPDPPIGNVGNSP